MWHRSDVSDLWTADAHAVQVKPLLFLLFVLCLFGSGPVWALKNPVKKAKSSDVFFSSLCLINFNFNFNKTLSICEWWILHVWPVRSVLTWQQQHNERERETQMDRNSRSCLSKNTQPLWAFWFYLCRTKLKTCTVLDTLTESSSGEKMWLSISQVTVGCFVSSVCCRGNETMTRPHTVLMVGMSSDYYDRKPPWFNRCW